MTTTDFFVSLVGVGLGPNENGGENLFICGALCVKGEECCLNPCVREGDDWLKRVLTVD